MKHNGSFAGQNLQPDTALRRNTAGGLDQNDMVFLPSAHQVAARAFLSYGTRVYLPEYELQHWLEAEKQLLAERGHAQFSQEYPRMSSVVKSNAASNSKHNLS